MQGHLGHWQKLLPQRHRAGPPLLTAVVQRLPPRPRSHQQLPATCAPHPQAICVGFFQTSSRITPSSWPPTWSLPYHNHDCTQTISVSSFSYLCLSFTDKLPKAAIPSHTRSPKDLPSVPPSLQVPLISGPSPLSLLCAAQLLSSLFHLINSILILVSMALSDPETRISLCNKITSLYLWVKYLFPLLSCKLSERKKKVSLSCCPLLCPQCLLSSVPVTQQALRAYIW